MFGSKFLWPNEFSVIRRFLTDGSPSSKIRTLMKVRKVVHEKHIGSFLLSSCLCIFTCLREKPEVIHTYITLKKRFKKILHFIFPRILKRFFSLIHSRVYCKSIFLSYKRIHRINNATFIDKKKKEEKEGGFIKPSFWWISDFKQKECNHSKK